MIDYNNPVEIVARTLYGEARSEGHRGMHAVANVINNRVKNPRWWGHDYESVCINPTQFSCWDAANEGNRKNYETMVNATKRSSTYREALDIAERAVAGALKDITEGADHYHADYVDPFWNQAYTRTVKIGKHIFYRSIELEKDMNDTKPWYASKGMWGAILVLVGFAVNQLGLDWALDQEQAQEYAEIISTSLVGGGGFMAFIGRLFANSKIGN